MKHYVYKITDIKTNQYYIGCRSHKNPKSDSYMGSMQTWKPENKNMLVKEIIADDFKTREEAIEFEAILIEKCIDDKLNENYHIPNKGFHVVGVPKTPEWRRKVSAALSGKNNPMYGKQHSENSIKKIKECRSNQILTERQLQNLRTMNSGKIFTPNHKSKISESLKKHYSLNDVWNKGIKMNELHRKKVSEAKLGKPLSDIHKKKLSESAKKRKRIKCPYCLKEGQKSIMIRWHFNNCKHNPNE